MNILDKEKSSEGCLHNKSIVEYLANDQHFTFKKTQDLHLPDLGSVRVNQPHISLLEEHQKKLVPEKLQADNHIFEGVSKPNPLDDISLIAEDTDVFEGWVVFSEGEDFSFVRGDGYWSSERGHRDEHVLVIEAVEPLSE